MAIRQSRDDVLFEQMVMFKRHMGSCRKCQAAKKTHDPNDTCDIGNMLVFRMALKLDDLISLRRKALEAADPFIYACPDVSKHGKAYAMTVLPMAVTGIQGRMF